MTNTDGVEKLLKLVMDKTDTIPVIINRLDVLNSFKQKCELERREYEARVDNITTSFIELKTRIATMNKAVIVGLTIATFIIGFLSFLFNKMERHESKMRIEKSIDRLEDFAIENRKLIKENIKRLEGK